MVNTKDMGNASYQAALQVAQQAIAALFKWADPDEKLSWQSKTDQNVETAVTKAKKIFEWTDNMQIGVLRLLFDCVKLSNDKKPTEEHWYPIGAIADANPTIPYSLQKEPDSDAQTQLKEQIQTEVIPVLQNQDNWDNLALLSLILEKYGSCLSFGANNVALVDLARITGAVAAALVQKPEAKHLSLVAGDLSGIQKFIYTISSEGALKSLRARSFYLELVTEEVIQQFLENLELPRTNIIYAGGGRFYLVAPVIDRVKEKIAEIANQFNSWLSHTFQNKIFLATGCQSFEIDVVKDKRFVEAAWNPIIKILNEQKNRKFSDRLSDLLEARPSYEPCKVCHRDDQPKLAPLSKYEANSVLTCFTCRRMFQLGEQIFKAKAIVRSRKRQLSSKRIHINLPSGVIYYNLYSESKELPELEEAEQLFWVNNWTLKNYCHPSTFCLLLGNYGKASEEKSVAEKPKTGFMRAGEFAQKAKDTGCIPRIGYLRMDVDRLGQIFAKGLGENYSLPKLAGLSRQMSYFFKVYLNSLAETRQLPKSAQKLTDSSNPEKDRPNLLFIYAGGDDLFISGAWNEVVEFAFDVYQSFRVYTGNNSDITLSGGISIDDVKFPLYQSAESSGEAEDQAKGNGRDSLGLFGKPFKWSQWIGATNAQTVKALINDLDGKTKEHLDPNDQPEWLGILPFVRSLHGEKGKYSRSFVRNLLITAELQEQAMLEKQKQIEQIKRKQVDTQNTPDIATLENEQEEIRYYLHLPKIAYTLARLPDHLRKPDPKTKEDKFKPIRTSLKNPYNAPYFRAIATWIELLTRNT